jgi:hypothetical protein
VAFWPLGNKTNYQLNRTLLETRSRSGRSGQYMNFVPHSEIEGCSLLSISYEGVSEIFRTEAVKVINPTTKRVLKLSTSSQLRANWHTDSLYILALPFTGASRHHSYWIDGGTSPEYFGFTLVCSHTPTFTFRLENCCYPYCNQMNAIYCHIHETNHVSRLYGGAAVLYLQSVLYVMLFRP